MTPAKDTTVTGALAQLVLLPLILTWAVVKGVLLGVLVLFGFSVVS